MAINETSVIAGTKLVRLSSGRELRLEVQYSHARSTVPFKGSTFREARELAREHTRNTNWFWWGLYAGDEVVVSRWKS